jgi:hypothetical protein
LENIDSTCSNIDDVYAVSSKFKPAKWHVKSKVDKICYSLEWHVKTKHWPNTLFAVKIGRMK